MTEAQQTPVLPGLLGSQAETNSRKHSATGEARFYDHGAAQECSPEKPLSNRGGSPAASGKKKNVTRDILFALRRGLKGICILCLAVVFFMGFTAWPGNLIDASGARSNLMSVLFLIGLVLVILEDHVGVNKSAVMLMTAVSMWAFLAAGYHPHESEENHEKLNEVLNEGLKEVGALILFLLPAMGVVESIDHFHGFAVVTRFILRSTGGRKSLLMPLLTLLVFFLSAVIDNLTATIVALKLLRHVVRTDRHLRHTIGGLIVIAANAGGAWSPVGDVTTTMLWLANKISVGETIRWTFLPSFMAAVIPMLGLYFQAWYSTRKAAREGRAPQEEEAPIEEPEVRAANVLVLIFGIGFILLVPVLKMVTGLPPYMGMLLALGVLWFVTDTEFFQKMAKSSGREAHHDDMEIGASPRTPSEGVAHVEAGSVIEALHQMDLTGLLFFAGVLLAVGALDASGVLETYAKLLVDLCGGSAALICSLLGVSSAIVDNVPLVQAAIDMFGDHEMDDPLWQLTALAAGTGGSILSVGSIAGVTLMTMEGVGYIWYVKRISLWALLGFAGGIGTFELQRAIFL